MLLLLGVILLMGVTVYANELRAPGQTAILLLALPLVIALVRPIRREPKANSLALVEVTEVSKRAEALEVEGYAVARKLTILIQLNP